MVRRTFSACWHRGNLCADGSPSLASAWALGLCRPGSRIAAVTIDAIDALLIVNVLFQGVQDEVEAVLVLVFGVPHIGRRMTLEARVVVVLDVRTFERRHLHRRLLRGGAQRPAWSPSAAGGRFRGLLALPRAGWQLAGGSSAFGRGTGLRPACASAGQSADASSAICSIAAAMRPGNSHLDRHWPPAETRRGLTASTRPASHAALARGAKQQLGRMRDAKLATYRLHRPPQRNSHGLVPCPCRTAENYSLSYLGCSLWTWVAWQRMHTFCGSTL